MLTTPSISRFFWLIVPIIIIVCQIILEFSFDRETLSVLHSEGGPHETLQSLVIGLAFLLALWMLTKVDWRTQKLEGIAIAAAALGSFYISGEEISWGQKLLHWDTPATWGQYNDQDETNLHNTSAWLDQKPRLLLFIGIIVSGLLVPALRRWKPGALPAKYSSLYPSDIVVPTALGVTLPYLIQEIGELLNVRVFVRESELQELYMYYFVLMYLLDLKVRILKR